MLSADTDSRAARIRGLLSGGRVNVSATEATLGYRLRQYHVGLVCWAGDATAAVDNITRLEHAISHVAAGQPLARLGRAAVGPGTISSPDGRPLGQAARAAAARPRPPPWLGKACHRPWTT